MAITTGLAKRSIAPRWLAMAGVLAGPAVSNAADRAFRAEYVVSLYGLPVAKASFDSTFKATRFAIDGSLSSSGVARLFDATTGTTRVRGVIGKDGATPLAFHSAYHSGDKSSHTTIRFVGDKVVKATNKPERKVKPKDWVNIPARQLAAALDPITATLIRADSVAQVCDRTLRIFDGEMRADVRLTHRSTGTMSGFDGPAVTCDAKLVPVAGYRKGHKQINYLANQSRITITFARLADTGFYTPVDASVGTQIGTVRVTARKIEAR